MTTPDPFADWWEKPRRPRRNPIRHDQPPAIRTEKACVTCGTAKPLADYHKEACRPDGHTTQCKPCRNAARRVVGDKYLGARKGEQHTSAKLTADDVRLIQALANEREELLAQARRITNAALAEKFEVHRNTINKIIGGRAWRHIA